MIITILENDDAKGIDNSFKHEAGHGVGQLSDLCPVRFHNAELCNSLSLICQFDTIGSSIYGKLVLALKISDNP